MTKSNEKKKKKPSYSALEESLKCANQEAKCYLADASRLREDLRSNMAAEIEAREAARTKLAHLERRATGAERVVAALLRSLEDAQARIPRA